jgi:RimJ/RimL family protein N-acetyltransferase
MKNNFSVLKNFNEIQIAHFLEKVTWNKFNLYPKCNKTNIEKHLLESLRSSFTSGKLFASFYDGQITGIISSENLKWDSDHFDIKSLSIKEILISNHFYDDIKLRYDLINFLLENLRHEEVKFISVNVDSWDYLTTSVLQELGFNYILTWINGIHTEKVQIPIHNTDIQVNPVEKSELEYYQKLSYNNYFNGGRFYFDKKFDSKLVSKMYEKLVESSYSDNDILLSITQNSKPIGLFICKKITCYKHINNLKIAPLRFLIIDPEARNKHLGYDLFASTLNYLKDQCDIITTGLEVHNLPSINLHSKLGFRFNFTHNVFHWWANDHDN